MILWSYFCSRPFSFDSSVFGCPVEVCKILFWSVLRRKIANQNFQTRKWSRCKFDPISTAFLGYVILLNQGQNDADCLLLGKPLLFLNSDFSPELDLLCFCGWYLKRLWRTVSLQIPHNVVPMIACFRCVWGMTALFYWFTFLTENHQREEAEAGATTARSCGFRQTGRTCPELHQLGRVQQKNHPIPLQ